jgi:hypothetical protein
VGVWLATRPSNSRWKTIAANCEAIQAEELIVFETTMATHRGAVAFPEAQSKANEALSEAQRTQV